MKKLFKKLNDVGLRTALFSTGYLKRHRLRSRVLWADESGVSFMFLGRGTPGKKPSKLPKGDNETGLVVLAGYERDLFCLTLAFPSTSLWW
jgi:hypothetical protein